MSIDDTHAANATSWVDSANDPAGDFPIQNLPFGTYRPFGDLGWRIGVAIGDQVLDLRAVGLVDTDDLNLLMGTNPAFRTALRHKIFAGLKTGSEQQARFAKALTAQAQCDIALPCTIGDYTDFYTSIHHATTVGKQFRPENPLLPNYKWIPIGYHGRASTVSVSRPELGHKVRRPLGQTRSAGDGEPDFGPCRRLDYELELGAFIAAPNLPGEPVLMAAAESRIFGLALLNDWSARDIQSWEYQPLGPFQSKNFASTVSPWIVTLQALEPFRAPFVRPAGDPQPLHYLDSEANRSAGAFDITLEVWLQSEKMLKDDASPVRLSQCNYRDAYWTLAQLIAHHTINGCTLRPGDMLGTGTQSGPAPEQGGSLLELSDGGKRAIELGNGERRTFLENGDTVILKAYCERPGTRRIGFGECRGTVTPARMPHMPGSPVAKVYIDVNA